MMKQLEEHDNFFCSVFTELKSLGVKVPKIKKFKSSIPKQARPNSALSVPSNKIFGICLSEQEKVSIEDYLLPKFIVASTSYLKKFTQKEIGLFRKAGSVSRQRDLRIKLEKGESIDDSEPNDVASLLKQWLRELPEPLIPAYLQNLFVRCQNLQVEDNRVSAVLLCCHLLPVDHFHTLKHLLDFLSDIAKHCDKNKMGAHNLALIMAPNIFVMGPDSIDKSSNNLVHQHTSVIELLINNAHRVGAMPPCSSSHLAEEEALKYGTDFDLSMDALDYSPSNSKKKRRSGTVQDLFTGIRKLVGQNSLSPNTSKRSNQDVSNSDIRSAYKRKADPEHLPSMSPLKKQATASSVLHNETLCFTPNNKITQSIFGVKEKTGSAHSRRKSFGFLKRREKKRQKSSKRNVLVDTELSVSTPDPFQEKMVVSLQEPAQDKDSIFDKSSPLLSPIDIENLFSKSGFVKKSISDCYLIVQNEAYQNKQSFSTSSSEGCLRMESSNQSPYNLRSNNIGKRTIKRKSDEVNSKIKPFVLPSKSAEAEKENTGLNCSLWFDQKILENSPMAKRRSPKQKTLSPKDANLSSNATVSFNQNNSSLIVKAPDQTDFLKVPNISVRKRSSRKKITESLKDINSSSVSTTEKSVSDISLTRSNIKDVNDTVPRVTSTQSDVVFSTASTIQNEEKVERKCSIKRQEAFIVKPRNSRKNALNQLKRADSIKISRSRSGRISHQNEISKVENKTRKKSDFNSTGEVDSNVKENEGIISTNISDRKHTKRNVRNGSIVRGRPNTIKTGLPSDAYNRYNNELISGHTKHQVLASTSSVDNDLFINVVNHSEKNDHDISIVLQIQNITLLSPKEEIPTKDVESKNDTLNCIIQTISADTTETKIVNDTTEASAVTDATKDNIVTDTTEVNIVKDPIEPKTTMNIRDIKTVSKRKIREKLYSNSDSKIHNMKKRSSKVSRINSFPEPATKLRPKKVRKLRAVKSSSPRKSLEKKVTTSDEIEKENVCIKDSQNQSNLNPLKTPETNGQSPETWVSGRQFLEAEEAAQGDISNKRESIAMILRNNPGHVRAKASLYDCRSRSSSGNTPIMLRSATPSGVFYDPQYSNMQSTHSQKKSTSIRSNKSTRRNSPLPPPPKFVIPDTPPIPSYPLKELTNISNTEDTMFSPSPAKKSFSTPNKDEDSSKKKNSKCTLKPKMNSYSGHTPYKLPVDRSKVFRSESSPLLPKVANKPSRKLKGSFSQSSLTKCHDFSPSSNETCFNSPVFKTRSSLSIEKLRSDQLLDEWNCEM